MDQREGYMYMDGYDNCVIGHATQFTHELVVYSTRKIIEKNMAMGMEFDDAVEYFYFNQAGAWMGDQTPVMMDDLDEIELKGLPENEGL